MPHNLLIRKQLKAALEGPMPFKVRLRSGTSYLINSKDDIKMRENSQGITIRDDRAVLTFHFFRAIESIEPGDRKVLSPGPREP